MSHDEYEIIPFYSDKEKEEMKKKAEIHKICVDNLTPAMIYDHIKSLPKDKQIGWLGALGRIINFTSGNLYE